MAILQQSFLCNFFPNSNPFIALIATFGAFAAGFVARPIGSIFFGRLGDRLGRHYAMNLAIIMMAVPTVVMAFYLIIT